MGAVFAEEVLDIRDPSVRLLSIGEEPEKGNQLTLEAHALLEESGLRFEGNVEGRALLEGEADVVVCDGFTGNVALKTLEGTIRTVPQALRSEIHGSAMGKLGGLLIRPAARGLRARLDPDTYDYQVFDITTAISKQVFPISLDTDHPSFRAGLNRLVEAADGMARAKARGGLVARAQQAGWAALAAATFVRLYLRPVNRHDLPAQIRVAPAW